jgi:aldose 1-epimerase
VSTEETTQSAAARAPSGEQIEIASGDHAAVVVEAGGGLRSYRLGGRELLDGFAADEMPTSSRGKVLVPWPNRIRDGSYEFGGESHQLPIDEVAKRNAIHGLGRWAAWSVAERGEDRVLMRLAIHPRPGYPFSVTVDVEYLLSADGLRVTTIATNTGASACPYGCGAHPYLTLETESIDELTLQSPAATVIISDERGIPVRAEPVEGTEFDFRRPRTIGATVLDHAFTDLERGEDGLARVILGGAERALELWLDASYGHLMLFTGDVPHVARRGLAVEPMSCPPNAFQTGEAVIRLEPGARTSARWGIRPS